MTDRELADRIVALGVGHGEVHGYYLDGRLSVVFMPAREFVRDWRVAGALMEKVHRLRNRVEKVPIPDIRSVHFNPDSLARAICEACVETLEEK